MSNPSLILPQSPAYGEDYVYAAQVEDGAVPLYNVLPLTFTRASGGTRINKDGLVQNMPYNLLENSNSFNSGAWILQSITSSTGITDPFGGNTGWQFNETTATDQHRFYYAFLAFNTGVITQSIYVKSLGRDQIFIGSNSNTENLIFTFSTGVISSVTGYTSTSATNVGNGWYRITATFFGFSPINCVFVQGYNGGLSYAGDTSKGFCAFGAQINIGSTAQPYLATTDRLNMPRITYPVGGGCGALLLEKQSTNLVTYSDVLQGAGQWGYSNEMTITEVSEINPMGVSGCLKFTTTSANADHRAGQTSYGGSGYVAGDVICATAFVKANGYNFVKFGGNFGDEIAWFNLSNGTVASQQSNVLSAKIENFGNGWYRITNVYTFQNTIGNGLLYFNITPAPTANSVYTGNGTSGCFAFGGQIEKNSSYATSYIPTTSTSATRIADACYKTGISNLIGQTEGTLYVYFNYTANNRTSAIVTIQNTTGSAIIGGETNSSNQFRYFIYNSVGVLVANAVSSSQSTGNHKIAIAYKANDFALYIDGTQINVSNSGAFASAGLDKLEIGQQNGALTLSDAVNQTIIYPTRLTNAELATLTTL